MATRHTVDYKGFEGVMVEYAREQGWEFSYDEKPVSTAGVFNESTFGPALLQAAQSELLLRGIEVDLGLILEDDDASMFGKRVRFDAERSGLLTQMWRLTQTAYQVDMLPRVAGRISLDLVPTALRADLAPNLQTQG